MDGNWVCENCGDVIEGEPVWLKEPDGKPLFICQDCANPDFGGLTPSVGAGAGAADWPARNAGGQMKRLWQAPPGYYWKVVVDPTRTGDDPGMFYGGHFRWSDIVLPGCQEEIPCPWPNGTVFENIRTGERVVVKRGRVLRVKEGQHGGVPDRPGFPDPDGGSRSRVHAGAR